MRHEQATTTGAVLRGFHRGWRRRTTRVEAKLDWKIIHDILVANSAAALFEWIADGID